MSNLRINLGAGNIIMPLYTNHDRRKYREEIKLIFDLSEKDWSKHIVKDSCEEIRAWDVIEHLDDPINFINNCWISLKKGGVLNLKACGWQNPNFWVDITHKKAYDIRTFDYFDPSTELGKEYGFYSNKRWTIIKKDLDRNKNVIISMTPIK